MGRSGILQIAAATLGFAASGGGFLAVGLPLAAAGAAGLLGGLGAVVGASLLAVRRDRKAIEARLSQLSEELAELHRQQAETNARFAAIEQRVVETPALVWRAATADIEVLGSLVSELAKSVSDHELRLAGVPADFGLTANRAEAPRELMLPQTSPPPASWFEDEAELGFTADPVSAAHDIARTPRATTEAPVSPPPVVPARPSPAMVAELKSTLATALMSDRLELCLQPFVTLPQRKVAGYEAVLRLKGENGELQEAEELRAVATLAGMTRDLDRILIERAAQVLRVLRARERVVSLTCAVAGDSLLDTGFRSAVETMVRGDPKLGQSIRLCVPLKDTALLQSRGSEALEAIRRTGVTLGVSAGVDMTIDAALLQKIGVTEVRLVADVLLATAHGVGDIHPADIAEMLQRRGMSLLVTGIDAEETVRDVLDFAATMAQGALFGGSRPVRPEVLQPRAVAEPNAAARIKTAKAAEAAPRPGRQSFRSLLRRA